MKPSSPATRCRLYTFRCNGTARSLEVPYPPHFPSPQAEAQMLRMLFEKLESEGAVLKLTHLGYVDSLDG